MKSIKFIDLCAGIGGFRVGLSRLGWECVYSCEIDDECERTYKSNFDTSFDEKDIFNINPYTLPKYDVLCAGFPCQPFSIAGRRMGFEDERGKIIFQIIDIVSINKPSIVFLENVTNLIRHDNGKTLARIKLLLQDLNYNIVCDVLDSTYFGIPQRRKRVYIIALTKKLSQKFNITKKKTHETAFRNFINHGDNSIPISQRWHEYIDLYIGKKSLSEMTFSVPKTRSSLERASAKANINNCILQIRSSGIRAISIDEPMPTFAVSHSGGGAMIPVYTGERRHLNLTEMKRIMGFPENFKFEVSRTNAIKQLSNAVCPPVINSIGEDIERFLIG